jgi:hypothetical protein
MDKAPMSTATVFAMFVCFTGGPREFCAISGNGPNSTFSSLEACQRWVAMEPKPYVNKEGSTVQFVCKQKAVPTWEPAQ